MTKDQLKHANGLQETIEDYKDHLADVKQILFEMKNDVEFDLVKIEIFRSENFTQRLNHNFLPIPAVKFFEAYIKNVEKQLEFVESQFAEM